MAHTHFFPVNDQSSVCQYFSKEGMEIWDKYFAPHIASNSANNKQGFQIPAPSCKLLEEGEFVEDDIGLDDDKSRPPAAPKRKRRTKLPLVDSEVGEEEIEKRLLKKGKLPDKDNVIGKATGKGVKSSGSSSVVVCAQQMKKKIFKYFPND
jgi:hypothetical protein